jgi:catechol 2,3-dioxygenase-like lactoylglutathione lyase family enzyme
VNQTIQVPIAHGANASSLTGPFVIRFVNQSGSTAPLIIPRATPTPYLPVTLDTTKATLVSATAESATGVKSGAVEIPASDWAFADCGSTPFPGKPDAAHLCVKGGFNPALLYELRYTAKDPLVLGIGFAATRDINSFFRYEKQDAGGHVNPLAGNIRWAVSEGSSQSGTFLRAFIHLGFNQDESGRIVWDGSNPHIASRVLDMNRRFAVPGGTVSLYELGMEAPLWWSDWNDAPRGRGKSGLLDRCRATNTCPKIMETFGSAEIYGLRASPMLVGTDAKADIPLPDNVRRYFFPGVTHGGGPGGFSTSTGAVPGGCDLPINPAPSAPMRAALLRSLVEWVTKGTPMPPSRYPTIADGTLVVNTAAAMGYPNIPGKPSAEHIQYPLLTYDLGPDFNYQDQSGHWAKLPSVKGVLPQLVPKVDADGNEVAGVKSPLQMAPLGTYTGWNVMTSGPFKGQMCLFASPVGGFIPFARTQAERTASGDPRPSLEERYHSHEGYVQAVAAAAQKLVKDGYLGRTDADAMLQQAAASTVLASASAQNGFADMIDHIHVGVPDQAKGAEWYHTHLGAALTPEGPDRVMYGTTRMIFQKTAAPKPSEGSAFDLIGFSVADLDAAVKKLEADGVKIVMPPMVMDGIKSALVSDPWGTSIELVQDPRKLGLHHIGLLSPDPAASLAWFADKFGGKVTTYDGRVAGINYGGIWLLAKKGEAVGSAGHAIDHIGFRPANVDQAVATMKARQVKVTVEPRPLVLPSGAAMRLAFIEDPNGARIEMVQRENLQP